MESRAATSSWKTPQKALEYRTMTILFWLAASGFTALYWLSTARAREMACYHGQKACRNLQLQFLDGSVVRYQTRIARSPGGQLALQRDYRFEFTADGLHRRQGHIRLCANTLVHLHLDQACPEEANPPVLILSTDCHEEADAIRSRTEKGSDCLH